MEVHYEMRSEMEKHIEAGDHHQTARQYQQWVPKTAAKQDSHYGSPFKNNIIKWRS
jgi:hypothetical protein